MKSGSQRQCAVMKDNDEAFGWGVKEKKEKFDEIPFLFFFSRN
jgi:hypothetical protein